MGPYDFLTPWPPLPVCDHACGSHGQPGREGSHLSTLDPRATHGSGLRPGEGMGPADVRVTRGGGPQLGMT